MNYYVGLLTKGHVEPDAVTGYARVCVEGEKVPEFDDLSVLFREASAPGYGDVTHIAIFDADGGDAPIIVRELPEPVNVHEGVVPIITAGKLLRGLAVSATVQLTAAGDCRM